jgi:hypothetical protein
MHGNMHDTRRAGNAPRCMVLPAAADMSSTALVSGFQGNSANTQKKALPMPLLVKKMVGE